MRQFVAQKLGLCTTLAQHWHNQNTTYITTAEHIQLLANLSSKDDVVLSDTMHRLELCDDIAAVNDARHDGW